MTNDRYFVILYAERQPITEDSPMAVETILKYTRNGKQVKQWFAKATKRNAAFYIDASYDIFAGVWSFTAHSFRANGVPVDLSDCPVNGTAILDYKVPAQLDDKDTLLTAVNTIASSIYSNSTFVKENHI